MLIAISKSPSSSIQMSCIVRHPETTDYYHWRLSKPTFEKQEPVGNKQLTDCRLTFCYRGKYLNEESFQRYEAADISQHKSEWGKNNWNFFTLLQCIEKDWYSIPWVIKDLIRFVYCVLSTTAPMFIYFWRRWDYVGTTAREESKNAAGRGVSTLIETRPLETVNILYWYFDTSDDTNVKLFLWQCCKNFT